VSGAGPEWIDSDSALEQFVAEALECEEYFLDTEFHRERTYFPQLALVQIRLRDRIVLVDPLAVDPMILAVLLDGPGLCVMHAAQQDLDVLGVACQTVPARIYDTQVAAGFLGMSTPSLANLVQHEFGLHLPKGDRLTDWLRRPLGASQIRYAASDVEHLPGIAASQREELGARGRLSWVEDACEELRTRRSWPPDPLDAWSRVKELRSLRGASRSVAVHVAAWRELEARRRDVPVRRVLSDIGLAAIAQAAPTTADEIRGLRGVEGSRLGAAERAEIVEYVERGRSSPPPEYRSAVTLIAAWVAELARAHDFDPTLVATRQDVVDLIRGTPDARLTTGWRAELVGRDVGEILSGRAALTFDGAGRLQLVPIG
jgi:ribonuclease D